MDSISRLMKRKTSYLLILVLLRFVAVTARSLSLPGDDIDLAVRASEYNNDKDLDLLARASDSDDDSDDDNNEACEADTGDVDDDDDDDDNGESTQLDEEAPGIGFEFESSDVKFKNDECSLSNTFGSKGNVVHGHNEPDWQLTADTSPRIAGRLSAEYMTNGKICKLGTGTARKAAIKIRRDFIDWKPGSKTKIRLLSPPEQEGGPPVENPCNPWSVNQAASYKQVRWFPQVTVALPLEAIWRMIQRAKYKKAGMDSPFEGPGILIASSAALEKMRIAYVHKKFFQTQPNGMTDDPSQDVKGFFSIVLSYVKGAKIEKPDYSPKRLLWIMPRTDFIALYQIVKPKIRGDLFALVSVLVCYNFYLKKHTFGSNEIEVRLDSNFCEGTVKQPRLKVNLGQRPDASGDRQIVFGVSSKEKPNEIHKLTVKDWIDSIQQGNPATDYDKLSLLDEEVDGSIGRLGDKGERLYGDTTGKVKFPIFEFRDQGIIGALSFPDYVSRIERGVLKYHELYKENMNAPVAGSSGTQGRRRARGLAQGEPVLLGAKPRKREKAAR